MWRVPMLSRRAFIRGSGVLLGAAALGPLLPGGGLPREWFRRAAAGGGCLEPIPDPFAAGWTKEGTEPFTPGVPLQVTDGTTAAGAFCNFFCPADALFASEIHLAPNLAINSTALVDINNNTGVHFTINDGVRQARAVVLAENNVSTARVVLETIVGFSTGLPFGSLSFNFDLRRAVDGTAELSAGGQSEVIPYTQLPGSSRPGQPTIEFGTYDVPAAAIASIVTLGLPRGQQVSFARFGARAEIALGPGSSDDRFELKTLAQLGAASDGINPLSEDIVLDLGPARWTIPAGFFARDRRGRSRFEGLIGTTWLEMVIGPLADRAFAVKAQGQGAELTGLTNPVSVSLAIGDDAGTAQVVAEIEP